MLTFLVYENGKPARDYTLRNAHLVGPDDIGIRAGIFVEDSRIYAEKASPGPAALVLQYELKGLGEFMLQTCLLPDRAEPYVLTVELARHRLMKLIAKQEDWAMFELNDDSTARKQLNLAREKFIEALSNLDYPIVADGLARESLLASLDASEELALMHADVLINRRSQAGTIGRYPFGCGVWLKEDPDLLGPTILDHFDYLRLPTPWNFLEPKEQAFQWHELDAWCNWAARHRFPVVAGPIICLSPSAAPQWLFMWEHDYEALRNLIYEHVETVVSRYRSFVSLWNVVSGLHINTSFPLGYEQIMDLTRMTVMLTRKLAPTARTLIEVAQPFGEYYATNPRSIPPLMYAEMIAQAGIPFDAYGVRLLMGQPTDGQWTRDLMQISAMLDRFNGLGKPVHVSAAAAPSEPLPASAPHVPHGSTIEIKEAGHSGYWRKPWSLQLQSTWVEAFYKVALSKPFVESVAWLDVTDHEGAELSTGGLIDKQHKAKPALRRLESLRKLLHDDD